MDPQTVRMFADVAEHPRGVLVGPHRNIVRERKHFLEHAWVRAEDFLRLAQAAYVRRRAQDTAPALEREPRDPAEFGDLLRDRLRAAMRLPIIETLFPAPWTGAARRMLPSPSPEVTATAMWGPILGWSTLMLLAESIDPKNPGRAALDLFDRIRLREPFGDACLALGFEGEEAWRVASRIKVGLLAAAGVGREEPAAPETKEKTTAGDSLPKDSSLKETRGTKPQPKSPAETTPEAVPATHEKIGLTPTLWSDPDVRWLCGVHQAGNCEYLIRERYEELLWWLLMPSLLELAAAPTPDRAAVQELSRDIDGSLRKAEKAGYRVDVLISPGAAEQPCEQVETQQQTATASPEKRPVSDRRDSESGGSKK